MSYAVLIDGVSAAFNFQTDVNSTDVAQANNGSGGSVYPSNLSGGMNSDSWKCICGSFDMIISQQLLPRTTFCGNGWEGMFAATKRLSGTLGLFQSKGAPGGDVSNPGYMFGTAGKGIPALATMDTGCTVTANIMCASDSSSLIAMANSSRQMAWAADGTYLSPIIVWP